MAVRSFNGTSDELECSIGDMNGATYGVAVFLVKRGATGDWNTLTTFNTDGVQFAFHPNSQLALFDGNTYFGPEWNNTTDWALIVYRVVQADAVVDFSIYDYGTQTWTHDTSGDTVTTLTALANNMVFSWGGSGDRWQGLIAGRAFWRDTVPWATTAAVEVAGLEDAASAWLDASPNAMHLFNQESTATSVTDVTENGADQTSISGTSVVTGDDPPGFSFALDEAVTAEVTHGLILSHSAEASSTVQSAVTHGLVLTHAVEASSTVQSDITHGLTLGHSVEASSAVQGVIAHGLILGHEAQVESTVDASVTHGLTLSHEVDASVGASTQIAHGLQLTHALESSSIVDASVDHGLSLTQSVLVDVEASGAIINHGLSLSQLVNVVVGSSTAEITHGLRVGHTVAVVIGVDVSGRPIQPSSDERPIQDQGDARPIMSLSNVRSIQPQQE